MIKQLQIKRILFPTDCSETSTKALPYAVFVAQQSGARLYIIHVVEELSEITGFYIPHISTDALEEEMERAARDLMKAYLKKHLKDFRNYKSIIKKGDPYREIVGFAKENSIDIIIMGTHGRSGLEKVLLGSTTKGVLKNAPCPVLSVFLPETSLKGQEECLE